MQMETAQPFGKYLLLECVAVGGMAEIFRAKTVGADGFEKEVAVKRILPSYSEDDGFVTMFKDEAKIAAQLDHPNIVKVFDFDEVGGDYYIAMELIRGTDLKRLLENTDKHNKRFTPTQVAYIASETAKALDYAHKRIGADGEPLGIVHRDVTPHNIMLSYEGAVKLMDFGIAKAASRATKTRAGTVKGKCAYMSPEQARGKPLDGRSDMFSLGIIMWEMLTGRRLFSGGSDFDVLSKVLKSEIIAPRDIDSNVPEGLSQIVMRVLNRDRDQRYTDCGHLLQELNAFLFSQPDAQHHQLDWYVQCLSGWRGHAFTELPDYVPGGGAQDDDFDVSEEATQMLSIADMEAKLGLLDDVDHNASTQAMDPVAAEQAPAAMPPMQPQQFAAQPHLGMAPGMHPGMMQPGYAAHPTGMMPGYAPHPSYANMQAMGMTGMMPYGMQPPPQKSRTGLIIGIVVMLLLLCGVGVLGWMFLNKNQGETGKTSEASAAEAGSGAAGSTTPQPEPANEAVLTLSTIPPGATVTINGEKLDRQTNIYGYKAVRGQPISITFELEGYEPLTIERRPLQPAITIEETLKPLPAADPVADAAGSTTANTDTADAAGSTNTDDATSTAEATADNNDTGSATTDQAAEVVLASLRVESDPPGSKVTIEGRDETVKTPATIEGLPVGQELTVTFAPSDRKLREVKKTVTLVAAADKDVLSVKHRERSTEESKPRKGKEPKNDQAGGTTKLTVTAIPWGQVYLDGKALGTTPVKTEVPSGSAKLEISFPAKKQRVSRSVTLPKGGEASFTYDFNNEDWLKK